MVERRSSVEPSLPSFQQCEQCDYDFLTDTGTRGCHYYVCPYLPEAMDVWCPTCRYNFAIRDGNAECGDPPRCEYAREVAPRRVRTLLAWQAGQVRR